MSHRALRWLFAVYVVLLCALAISDPSLERGSALLVLAMGLTILVREIDIGIVADLDDDDAEDWEEEGETAIDD